MYACTISQQIIIVSNKSFSLNHDPHASIPYIVKFGTVVYWRNISDIWQTISNGFPVSLCVLKHGTDLVNNIFCEECYHVKGMSIEDDN